MKKTFFFVLLFTLCCCAKQQPKQHVAQLQPAPFSPDSAFQFVAEQVAFGPRTLNTEPHRLCEDYLAAQLERFGAKIEIQEDMMTDYEGESVQVKNIIGVYNPEVSKRVLLAAHYDSRPWADHDPFAEKRHLPIDGANDGASGVGVLLEIARQLQMMDSKQGIDIVFFDAEDMGAPDFFVGDSKEDDWCLGSQMWAEQCKKQNRAGEYVYGVVLDMVGAGDAVFPREFFSMQYASEYVKKIWQTAAQLGYGSMFQTANSYPITDDHFYVNSIAGIPCLDIIHYQNPTAYGQSGFCQSWHTTEDNINQISKNTLNAVGTVLLTNIINE